MTVLIAVEATNSGAPWWGTALIAGAFTVVGSLLAFATAFFTDRRRAERETRERWLRDQREVCAQLSSAVHRYRHNYFDTDSPVPLGECMRAIEDAYAELELVADVGTIAAALRLMHQLALLGGALEMQRFEETRRTIPEDRRLRGEEFIEKMAGIAWDAHADLLNANRKALGLPTIDHEKISEEVTEKHAEIHNKTFNEGWK